MKHQPGNPRPSAPPPNGGGAAAVPPDSPPTVIRGANSHPTICIDWLRLSGPVAMLTKAREILQEHFGPLTPGGGRFPMLDMGEHVGAGGLFYSTNPETLHAIVDLPASLLREIDPTAVLALADALMWHSFKATRIDIAVDFTDQPELIARAQVSCQLGELCHAKRFEPKGVWSGGKQTAHGVNIGGRGKMGSGRYIRIYDKGLEQQTKPIGEWVRWEAEFTGDVGASVLAEILASGKPYSSMIALAFGAVDFRVNTGDPNLSRRPRVPWFSDLLGAVEPHRMVAVRAGSTPAGYTRWVHRCVLPKLRTLSVATENNLEGLALSIAPPVRSRVDHLADGVVRGILTELAVPIDQARARLLKAGLNV